MRLKRARTAEQRKNTRPDIDRSDVVFAEGSELNNSIGITTDNRLVVVVNDDITKGLKNDTEIQNAVKVAIRRFKKVPINKQSIYFLRDTANEYTGSKYTRWLEHNDRTTYLDKMRVGQHPQDIIYATTDYINEGLNHPRKDDIIDFARGRILIDVSGNQYEAEVVIGFTKKGICELHDIVKMTPTTFKYKENAMSKSMGSLMKPTRSDMTSSNDSISQNSDLSTENSEKNFGSEGKASRELDFEYLSAVESGDIETAQRMVDEAALFYELLGGYIDENYFIPVRLGVKGHSNGRFSLYVIVCQDKIEKTRILKRDSTNTNSKLSHSPLVNISISQIIDNVNSKDLLRYLPDESLSKEQKEIKYGCNAPKKCAKSTIVFTRRNNRKGNLVVIKRSQPPKWRGNPRRRSPFHY